MKEQAIFNKVAKHLLEQGAPAKNGETCVYRALDGKRCAVGCLISDKYYDPCMEGNSVDTMMVRSFDLPSYFEEHLSLLSHLQDVHDDCSLTKRGMFKKRHLLLRLRQVAKTFNLKCEF